MTFPLINSREEREGARRKKHNGRTFLRMQYSRDEKKELGIRDQGAVLKKICECRLYSSH